MRRRVDWVKIVNDLNHNEIFVLYFMNLRKLHCGKSISFNRAAYNALKNYYSTTTIDQLCEKLGI